MGLIFLRNRVSGVAPAFDPASLFASGEDGFWYDPSDLTTMWTDTAGTTQTTAVLEGVTPTPANEVARIDDKSGNGNHATQGTAADRPILRQTAGGLYYLEFNGVNDFMQSAPTGWAATQTAWISAAANSSDSDTSKPGLVVAVSNGQYGSGGEVAILQCNVSGNIRWSFDDVNSAADDTLIASSPDITAPAVLTGFSDGTNAKLRRNGSEVATAATNITSAIIDLNQEIDLGAIDNGGTILFISPVNLYGVIMRLDAPDATDITNTETYLANRSGVTL